MKISHANLLYQLFLVPCLPLHTRRVKVRILPGHTYIPKARARHPPKPSLPGGSFGSSPNPHCDPDWGFVIRLPPTAADITVPLANTWTRWHPRKPPRPNPCSPAGRVSNGSLQFSKSATIWLPVQSTSSAQALESAKGHYNHHVRAAT
ncbi:unnamed protein product [Fusarium graminearum]|uniref:Chromosome 1, complete genome n=1 Tax=Gibberella zeae (strain ATCC MYA-4620 / CBS 123657 / FGSC 9075 / NRRL 31084 / PH-1) TaxID=229533 RepID=I1RD75_GIBZE|nr:hypothetical protein FGSG_01565 [Fusarium graminearum PH-1]ESU06892.1 hypothetical protein FGSG_01565 [Fusarium graminearum PH-1]EYB22631.1 hypothetical protein FG05_01565 [Fusarium graminearum]CEF73712.1 unnamed protein product [Fusarium graminearum]CZS76979.1 unnamed protein product [Fusarium graminearum]|eukprot:XP_011317377.1 hypothetical protein FGSG_01565 [Fusarium graminearum PH-1]